MEKVACSKAKSQLNKILQQSQETGEPIAIEDGNECIGGIVCADDLALLEQINAEIDLGLLKEAEQRKRSDDTVDWDDVKYDLLK